MRATLVARTDNPEIPRRTPYEQADHASSDHPSRAARSADHPTITALAASPVDSCQAPRVVVPLRTPPGQECSKGRRALPGTRGALTSHRAPAASRASSDVGGPGPSRRGTDAAPCSRCPPDACARRTPRVRSRPSAHGCPTRRSTRHRRRSPSPTSCGRACRRLRSARRSRGGAPPRPPARRSASPTCRAA